jgi:hypothetical protein
MLMPKPVVIRHRHLMKRRANLRPDAVGATTLARHLLKDYRLHYNPKAGSGVWEEPESGVRWGKAEVIEHPHTAMLAKLTPAQWRALAEPGRLASTATEEERARWTLTVAPGTAGKTVEAMVKLGLVQAYVNSRLTDLGREVALLVAEHDRMVDALEGPAVINR